MNDVARVLHHARPAYKRPIGFPTSSYTSVRDKLQKIVMANQLNRSALTKKKGGKEFSLFGMILSFLEQYTHTDITAHACPLVEARMHVLSVFDSHTQIDSVFNSASI